jgi:hypothetical protein
VEEWRSQLMNGPQLCYSARVDLRPFNFGGVPIMAKAKRGLDGRHRDKSGRIEKKHGNTRLAALRKEYGPGFAKGHRKTLLKKTGSASLHEYLRQHHK